MVTIEYLVCCSSGAVFITTIFTDVVQEKADLFVYICIGESIADEGSPSGDEFVEVSPCSRMREEGSDDASFVSLRTFNSGIKAAPKGTS